MGMARVAATGATCGRRAVGCVLADRDFKLLSAGYNGVPSKWQHCTTHPCPGREAPSGTGLELCEAIHAEQNALLQCPDHARIHYCITTASPCVTCLKLLLNTPCQVIFFREEYPHSQARVYWERAGRLWQHWDGDVGISV
jgi:dCMP deaminase